MRLLFKTAIFVLFLQLSFANAAVEPLSPEKEHMVTTLEIIKKLQTRHYEKRSIDDQLSEKLLASFLDMIDGNRQTFMQQDIDKFTSKYKTSLDDRLKRGDVNAGFEIFNIYRERAIQQLEKTIKDLPALVAGFDFTKDESIEVDRSEAKWPTSQKEIDDLWRKRLKAATLSLKLSDKEPDKIAELLTKRYKNQLDRLIKLNSEDVFQFYINAFTQLYDPHTNYLSPASSDNFDISMSLKLEGIGAMLRLEDEYTKVVRLVHAGPADKQGELQPSDRIIAVAQGKDGELVDVVGWRLDEVVNLIRGKKGTVVRLEVIPAKAVSDDETRIISIVRDEVKLEEQAVQKAMLDVKDERGIVRKIGVIDIPAFYIDFDALRMRDPNYRSTTKDTAEALSQLMHEGAEGIIIDLRNNGGGSLREANQLTSLFIEKGPSVQIRLSDERIYSEEKKYPGNYFKGPLVVLMNRMSASASEIFAGAMQDYQRAVIVGSQSYGKGTVQSLSPLNHGKLKITESKFYRISGESTQNRGVLPDIELPAIYDSEVIGESSLDQAMQWDTIASVPFTTYNNYKPVLAQVQKLSAERGTKNPDFIFLNKKASYEKELAKKKELSLNEKDRITERKKNREYQLQLVNEKRIAKGEKPLDKLENEDAEDKDADNEEVNSERVNIDLQDPYLFEAANILLDTQTFMSQLAAKQ